jgi:predicted Zn-dependent protease
MRAKAGAKADDIKSQLEAAVKRFPDSDAPRIALVTALLEQGEAKAALQVANEGAVRFPENPRIQEMMGLAEMAAGNYNQAAQAFNKMIALQPNAVEPMVRLAEVHLARKDVPAAIAQLRKVVGIKPDFVRAQASLITLLSRTGKMDEALAQAKAVQAQMPNEPYGWVYEGDLQASRGNKAAAVAALRTGFAKRAAPDTAMKLHRALTVANQTAEADKLEADWLAKQPNDAAFHFYLGDQGLRPRRAGISQGDRRPAQASGGPQQPGLAAASCRKARRARCGREGSGFGAQRYRLHGHRRRDSGGRRSVGEGPGDAEAGRGS